MEIWLENQLEIIEQEMLISCKAKMAMTPLEERVAVVLESQDLHILCKLAKSNNMDVICYDEETLKKEQYYINKEFVADEYPDMLPYIEKDIDKYNFETQRIDFTTIQSVTFYFIAYGKYYIQKIRNASCCIQEFVTGEEKLQQILELRAPEIEKIIEKKKMEQEELTKEFLDFARKDAQFVLQNIADYARSVFISNDNLEKYRTIFFEKDDVRCESQIGLNKCCRELTYLKNKMKQEKQKYRNTEEYAKRMLEFEEFVRNDERFWAADFPGYRRDYSYQVFLTNPQAEKYRTLFYAEPDTECKEHDARRDCFYQLERIYNARKKS